MMQEKKSEYQVRMEKIDQLRKWGVNPFVENFDKTHTVAEILEKYSDNKDLRDSESTVSSPQIQVKTAGRITLFRVHGKLAFAKLQDGT